MADVRENHDRGQLILVTGLAVAVTLVALVLLLNTVIYTQNLATRGAQIDDGEAVAFRGEVAAGVGDLVDAENREEYDARAKVEDNVTEGVGRYDDLLSRYRAERGTVAEIRTGTLSLTDGVLLRQTNASRNFTSASEAADWTLAEGVGAGEAPGARNVRLTVSGENLSDGRTDSFRVRLEDDDGTEWRAFVYNDTDDDIAVAVKNGTDAAEVACTTSGPEATVDLARGTLNGTDCPALVWAAGLDAPYDLAFGNADEATGTYELTVDTSDGGTDAKTGEFAAPDAEESPRWARAVYAAEFEVHFETPKVAFHTTVRTAPGEPR